MKKDLFPPAQHGFVLDGRSGLQVRLRRRHRGHRRHRARQTTRFLRQPSWAHVFNARLGWRGRSWEFAVDVLNISNRQSCDIASHYTSRLPDEPTEGVDDIHFHPAEKRTVRISAPKRF